MKRFWFFDCKPTKTQMLPSMSITADLTNPDVNVTLYRRMIGSLLYLTISRPDIMFATILCAQYQANPKESHLHAIKIIFRYLKHTPNIGLLYPCDSEFKLVGYTDSDHDGCGIDRKSTSGGAQLLRNQIVSWSRKKQMLVACSTTKA